MEDVITISLTQAALDRNYLMDCFGMRYIQLTDDTKYVVTILLNTRDNHKANLDAYGVVTISLARAISILFDYSYEYSRSLTESLCSKGLDMMVSCKPM